MGILIFEMLCGFTPFWDSGSPLKIYENILKGRVKYPPYIHPDAQDLLSKLITHDLTKRLGNLHGGSKDVMQHPWFAEVTWERLAKKDIDAPYVPPVKGGVGDASLFDKYPEETESYGNMGEDAYVVLVTEISGDCTDIECTDTASCSLTSRVRTWRKNCLGEARCGKPATGNDISTKLGRMHLRAVTIRDVGRWNTQKHRGSALI